jgi:membrane protein
VSLSEVKLLLGKSVACWSRHNAPRMGAALAYYTLLSLMPLLLVVISIAGLVFGSRAAESRVMDQMQFLIGDQRARILSALLQGAENKTDGLLATAIGTVILLFGASGVLIELRDALNNVWDVPSSQLGTFEELKRLIKERLWSLGLVLVIVMVLTASLLFSASISAVGTLTTVLPAPEAVLHLLNALFSFVAITIAFGAIYKFVPQVLLKWRDVMLGAAVSGVLFVLGNVILGLYLGKASFSSTYGAASSTVALAIWVYYSSLIFFLGAEFTRAFAETYGSAPLRRRPRAPSEAA